MHIESVTLQNFRCFKNVTITLGPEVTVLIGANGAGKSAFIEALRRLFGVTTAERRMTRADVYFGHGETPESVQQREVVIDVVLAFPELREGDDDAARSTVPRFLSELAASTLESGLKARLRLEALWQRRESYADDLETAVYWVTTMESDVPFGEEDEASLDKRSTRGRSPVRIVHIPATRDGAAVTRHALGQLLRRIEQSGDFGEVEEAAIRQISDDLQQEVSDLPAVEWVTQELMTRWGDLHDGKHLKDTRLVVLSQEFAQIIRSLNVQLSPAPSHRALPVEELSEGQTSLFFLALTATLAELESRLAKGDPPEGFSGFEETAQALTIYAVEEPENHLAPFYLSRLLRLLTSLTAGPQAMGIVTSHAPAVVRRVKPEQVRHLRLDPEELASRCKPIRMPDDTDEADKFVRQAVLSQPELYFAKLVILGEGDSEAVVLPRLAKAFDCDLDPSFVTFAPLGGRHVNHFWRLLNDLDIPHLTLLDFDLGRANAGPLRFKYVYEQLKILQDLDKPKWLRGDPHSSDYWRRRVKESQVSRTLDWMTKRGVFFAYPLDLDMMMLQAYPAAYGVGGEGEAPSTVLRSVFGKAGKAYGAYAGHYRAHRPSAAELHAYDRLFKKRSKPASHLEAIANLSDEELREGCPRPLKNLLAAAMEHLGEPLDPEGAGS